MVVPSRSQAARAGAAIFIVVFVNLVLPLVIYSVAVKYVADVYALLLSSIPPFVNTLVIIARERRCDVISALSVLSISMSTAITFVTRDARLLMAKDSFFTVGFGVAYWASTMCGKEDLIWFYNREFRGPEAKEELDMKYNRPDVRSNSYFMCRVWGTGLLLEAAVRLVLIYTLPVSTMAYLSTLLMASTIFCLVLWTKCYVARIRRQQAASEPLLKDSL
ncbi:hypothetical protein LEN26_012865 [Aphanomyces euteiches]|nr:hypothetical protein AeMF1_018617 [Aphanomyces euteiches]KAH9116695.1 hypothetical protein LEN26_012865 [Aphanomyces euteiches]